MADLPLLARQFFEPCHDIALPGYGITFAFITVLVPDDKYRRINEFQKMSGSAWHLGCTQGAAD